MSLKNKIDKICTVCSAAYSIRLDRADASKYCSKQCWNNRRVLNTCEHCKGEIKSYHGKKYCSRVCSKAAMVGEKSSFWIDGKSLERDRARLSSLVKEWRNSVYKRDGYKCQHCGIGTYLHAHHIIEWAKDESKRFDVGNGLTLCIDCHGKVHGKDFKRKDKKKCPDCGKIINQCSKRCRTCATNNQWGSKRVTAKSSSTE